MRRRTFIQNVSLGTLALGIRGTGFKPGPTHLITLSFDDGFKQSFLEAASIYEDLGLSGCFNVIASAHLPEFTPPNTPAFENALPKHTVIKIVTGRV